MKRSKYSDEQILAIVKEGEAGRKVADLCRTHGITEQTYYRWKAKYGGMELSEMQRLKQLEDENRRLRYDEVGLALECDLDGGLPEEQRVIPNLRLHGQVLHLGAVNLPRFLVHARGLGHRRSRTRGDNAPALHLAALEGRGREVKADVGALLAFFRRDEHAVAYNDEAFWHVVRHPR